MGNKPLIASIGQPGVSGTAQLVSIRGGLQALATTSADGSRTDLRWLENGSISSVRASGTGWASAQPRLDGLGSDGWPTLEGIATDGSRGGSRPKIDPARAPRLAWIR
jgi:hypothetical protein